MKKKILLATISTIVATLSIQATAQYMVKYQIEPTPNSIIIKGWFDTDASISDWLNTGNSFNCGAFTPLENTITINQSFEQSRDCSVNQERTIQNRKISENGTYKNEGSPIFESRIESIIEKNNSIGTLETWSLTDSEYTGWVNSGTYYDCTNWTPSADTIEKDLPFEQTASDCKLNQTQNRQDREIEITTGVIRNKGAVVENQTLTGQTNTQNSIGTKSNKVCPYNESGIYFTTGAFNTLFLYDYTNIPSMTLNTDTGKSQDFNFGGSAVIPGINRISSIYFTYTTFDKIWIITRGDYVRTTENGFKLYKVCLE